MSRLRITRQFLITPLRQKKMANYAITPEKLANYAFTQPYNPPPCWSVRRSTDWYTFKRNLIVLVVVDSRVPVLAPGFLCFCHRRWICWFNRSQATTEDHSPKFGLMLDIKHFPIRLFEGLIKGQSIDGV